MKSKWIKILFFSLILIVNGAFFFYKINLPSAHDMPRQIQNGKDILSGNFDVITKNVYSYTEPDQHFANHHWLFGVFAYIAQGVVGWNGVVVLRIIIFSIIFIILFSLAKKRSDFWIALFFAIPTILILISRTSFRPEMFSYLFLAIFLYSLNSFEENPKSNKIFWLILVELIWLNTHILFPVGIMLVVGFFVEKLIRDRGKYKSSLAVKKLGLLIIALSLTLFFNPYGLKWVIYSLRVNTSPDFPIHSMEITTIFNSIKMDPTWDNISTVLFIPFVTVLFTSFAITVYLRYRRKESLVKDNLLFYFLASVGSAGLSFFVFRGMPMFGAIFFISMAIMSNDLFRGIKAWANRQTEELKKYISSICMLSLAFLLFLLFYLQHTKIMAGSPYGLGLTNNALSSVQFIKDNNIKGPIFNDTDSGSYLIGELYPQEKVFSDNRFGDAYSASFFKDIYIPMTNDEDIWKEMMEKYKFNVIFFYHYDEGQGIRNFLFRRIYDKDWVWVYADNYNIILVKNSIENKDVIDKYRITQENVYDKLSYLSNSKDPGDILNAADIFNLLGDYKTSIPLYLKYLSLRPNGGKIWYNLGKTELTKSDTESSNPYLAAIYLERAIDVGWKTWLSYSYLALAYYRTGQYDRARWAFNKEVKINPVSKDVTTWRKVFSDLDEQKIENEQQ